MIYGQETKMTTLDNDLMLLAARATMARQSSAVILDRELARRLQMGEATRDQLRADIRQMIAAYRAWRRDAACGRAVADRPSHLPLVKQLRRAWATYRLVQLLLRDMVAMAGPMGAMENFNPIMPGTQQERMPSITPAPVLRTPANTDGKSSEDKSSNDEITLEKLEQKYGPSLAQKLFEEIRRQNGSVAPATVKISD